MLWMCKYRSRQTTNFYKIQKKKHMGMCSMFTTNAAWKEEYRRLYVILIKKKLEGLFPSRYY